MIFPALLLWIQLPNCILNQFVHQTTSRQLEKSTFIKYFLVDNGSLRAESVLYIRDIARQLSKVSGKTVNPAGIMHSHKVDPLKLNGIPGLSMEAFFQSEEANEAECMHFIPMFLGPSLAITDWLKVKADEWIAAKTGRDYKIADCLFQDGDERIANALYDQIIKYLSEHNQAKPYIILVDHGTPLREVNYVREEIGTQLAKKLQGTISGFSTASMERRDGDEYAFNDPLLEKLLMEIHSHGQKNVVLAQLFLAPGRHAGPEGDIEKICLPFENDGLKIHKLPTLGNHPYILEILAERLAGI